MVNVASGLAHLTVPFATAYCMSKRGLVGYSDALRLEHGDAITVTTVYPGYIRTPIHDAAARAGHRARGRGAGRSSSSDAAGTLVRAALGPPARDLATTRRGTRRLRARAAHAARGCWTAWRARSMRRLARKGALRRLGAWPRRSARA